MEKLGGRKFVMLVILLISGALIDVFGPNGLGSEMAAFMVGLYVSYTGGNVFSKYAASKGAPAFTVEEEEVDSDPFIVEGDEISTIKEDMAQQQSLLQEVGNALIEQGKVINAINNKLALRAQSE